MKPVSGFFSLNRRLSLALASRLPSAFTYHLHTLYKHRVAEVMNRRPGQIVIDVGGGKDCPFLPYLADPSSHLVIVLDCSEAELRGNRHVAAKIVADAVGPGLPVRDGSADLVVSRSLAEHLRDNRAYFANCARALRPGGMMIHALPCRFAPFAMLNKIVPNRLARRLIAYFLPDWAENGSYGFIAFYDRCHFSGIRKLVQETGLENERYVFTYYQSMYFTSFFPVFCVMVAYDLLVWALQVRNLASGMLVIAERPAAAAPPAPVRRRAAALAGADGDD